ncbi:26S proteasome non-ATPase regulatory subunit 10, partial [Cladochytrium tenue]
MKATRPTPSSPSPFVLAYEGRLADVRRALDADAALVRSIDEDQRTLLHWAASGKHIEIAQMVLDAGANVNSQDD